MAVSHRALSRRRPGPPGYTFQFFSPFETGYRPITGWRWYWSFLNAYPSMIREVEHDCFAAIDVVMC